MEERLQRLREALRLEWKQLAERLGMSRAMLDFVRKGQRNLSFPALARLEEVERSAGIAPPARIVREIAPAYSVPSEKVEISAERRELHAIGAELRKLCARVDALEERLNKYPF